MRTKKQEADHQYYLKNREKLLAKNKEYAKQNKERFRDATNERRRKWQQTWKGFYNTAKVNAKKRGIPFEVTQQEFFTLYMGHPRICFYCWVPEELLPKDFKEVCGRVVNRLSIDRKDPSIGYTKDNIVFCCFRCNAIKSDFFTVQEMFNLAQDHVKPKWQNQR